MWPEFEAALKSNQKSFVRYLYPGTRHGFHNNSTPRYNEAAVQLAWERTVNFFTRIWLRLLFHLNTGEIGACSEAQDYLTGSLPRRVPPSIPC